RRPASFQVVAADEPFDASLAPLSKPDELARRGKTEIVRVLLPLAGVEPKEALAAVKSMQGPFGQALPVGKRLLLRDTVTNLRQIVGVVGDLGDVEARVGSPAGQP